MPLQYRQYARLVHPEAHSDGVSAIDFSTDGSLLGSAGLDGRVCIWDVQSSKLLYVFLGNSPVLSLRWLDSHATVVCGTGDGTIITLRISTTLIKLDGFWAHRYPVERLAFNGPLLASGSHKEVKIWRRTSDDSWMAVADLGAPRQSSYTDGARIVVTSLHWIATRSHSLALLITYMSHGIVAFDAQTWTRIGGTAVPGRIADSSLTQDGRLLAISNMMTGFELFSLKGLVEIEPLFTFRQDVGTIYPIPVQFFHGDHGLFGGTSNGRINIWDVYSRKKQPLPLGGETTVLAVSAHHTDASDDPFIATGVFGRHCPSAVLIWKAEEARQPSRSSLMREYPRLGYTGHTAFSIHTQSGKFALFCMSVVVIFVAAWWYDLELGLEFHLAPNFGLWH